jgi:hypothetical protein
MTRHQRRLLCASSASGHAAEQRDELATPQLIELHSIPASQAGLQDTELARISQEVTNPLPRVADV